jgi:hypothetical protein
MATSQPGHVHFGFQRPRAAARPGPPSLRGAVCLTEFELDKLPGYEGSKPVRIGNAASAWVAVDRAARLIEEFGSVDPGQNALPPLLAASMGAARA